jgi:hypothetical protein
MLNNKDLDTIRNESWVYVSGYKIGDGDYIEFVRNGLYELRKDSIFKKNYFVGRIVCFKESDNEITIQTPTNGISVYYYHDFK